MKNHFLWPAPTQRTSSPGKQHWWECLAARCTDLRKFSIKQCSFCLWLSGSTKIIPGIKALESAFLAGVIIAAWHHTAATFHNQCRSGVYSPHESLMRSQTRNLDGNISPNWCTFAQGITSCLINFGFDFPPPAMISMDRVVLLMRCMW